ncbi:hypothetical protein FE257_003989 [Aspergillus nanangensis]|uniref:Zn(2)-C6 fungal-type domain-containing protein n=1 Tax=Aspergillus nanangensis TaxID=2582783 RepID=A0AAD4GW49_ASPNN|nr:hypothetical protein FE257_003989 [Aspergillus nanangensis]
MNIPEDSPAASPHPRIPTGLKLKLGQPSTSFLSTRVSAAFSMQVAGPNPTSPGPTARQKRPAWEQSKEQPSKRRASQACLSCRHRKVRCDLVSGGHPCTNCRLDSLECVVKESSRGRRPGVTSTVSVQAPVESPARDKSNHARSSPVQPSRSFEVPSPRLQRPRAPSNDLGALNFGDQQGQNTSDAVPTDEEPVLAASQSNIECRRNPSPRAINSPVIRSPTSATRQTLPRVDSNSPLLPPYIRPLPRHIAARDLDYLADKGALSIPDNVLRDEILRAYVTMVHPFMPTVDLEDFLVPIIHGDGRGSVSLILFQAVMFAGVSYIDTNLLQSRGYSSKKAARKTFFGRVRLLYGLEVEQEHLPLLQAVLLMTYWYDCPDDGKNSWYWTGIALSLAQVVGIHRETELCRTTAKKKRMRRKIWWSCVIQDRLLALGIRQPSRIRDDGFDMPRLTLNDFDLNPPSDTIISFLRESGSIASDPSARSTMAVMCVELGNLAMCLGHILHSQYSAVSDQPMIAEYMLRIIVVPKRSRSSQQDLSKCDAELNEWLTNQDARARYTPGPQQVGEKNKRASQIIRLHQAILHMNYLCSVNILHKPQVLYSESDAADDSVQKKLSREKVTKAAIAMAKLGFDMQMDNQLQYLSTSSVPAFLSATLSHLLEIRSHDEEVRNVSVGRFYQCMHVLQQLQSMYSSADYAVHFLAAVLRNVNITVPSLISGLPSTRPNWNKPQLLGCPNSTPDSEVNSQVATAYPSPSSCPHHTQPCTGVSDGLDNHSAETGTDHPRGSQYSQASPDFTSQVGAINVAAGDFLPDSYMGNWLDLGSLVPALVNFDGSTSWPVANNVTSEGELGLFYD